MIQRLRVPLGFVIAAIVLYLATPRGITILAGLPIALAGAIAPCHGRGRDPKGFEAGHGRPLLRGLGIRSTSAAFF